MIEEKLTKDDLRDIKFIEEHGYSAWEKAFPKEARKIKEFNAYIDSIYGHQDFWQ